jgi:5'-3' exonuclease
MKRDYLIGNPEAGKEEVEEYLAATDYQPIALHNAKTVLESMTERFNENFMAFIQEGRNFRYDVATIKPYKDNRNDAHKPKYYKEIKDYLVDCWSAIPVSDIESDDALAIEQYKRTDKYSVIVSTDKDMMCVPGWHYNWVKGILHYQTLNEANLFHFYQMLTGDTVDNIQGIAGIGPVKAGALIQNNGRDVDRVRQAVQEKYKEAYGDEWETYYQEVSRLLYILRKYEHRDTGCPFLY